MTLRLLSSRASATVPKAIRQAVASVNTRAAPLMGGNIISCVVSVSPVVSGSE